MSMWRPRYLALASRNEKQPTAPHISAMPLSRARRALAEAMAGGGEGGEDKGVFRSPDGAKRNPGTPYPRRGLPRIPLRSMRATRSALIQRLDLDDGRAEIAADPQHGPIAGVVDEDAPDVGGARQQVFDHVAGLRIEPRHLVVEHRAGPHLAFSRRDDVVGRAPGRGQPPFLDGRALRIEQADAVGAVLGEPQPVLGIDAAAARPRAGGRGRPDGHDAGLGVAPADARAAEFQEIEVVGLIGRHAVGADLLAARVLGLADVLPAAARDVEPIGEVVLLVVAPDLAVDVHVAR